MRCSLVFIILISISLLSCNKQKSETDNNKLSKKADTAIAEDYRVINATFEHLANPGPEGAPRTFGYDNFIHPEDSVSAQNRRKIFFTSCLVPYRDSSVFLNRSENNISFSDSSFAVLLNQLKSGQKAEAKLNSERIVNTANYRISPFPRGKKINRKVGEKVITYSTIVYDAGYTKAVFYFQSDCAGLCGYAAFVCVEKRYGIWTIVDVAQDWVS